MKICVIGAGFVGLVTSVYFAESGHEVICVDFDEKKIDSINSGKAHFFERGLDKKLKGVIGHQLRASTDFNRSVNESSYIFVCVGTPTTELGKIDLSFIIKVSDQLAEIIRDTNDIKTIVVKSTVVPGTTRKLLSERLAVHSQKENGKDFFVAMNPEFLREGNAVSDMFDPDRIIVGSDDAGTQEKVLDLYLDVEPEIKLGVSLETAEMAKYVSNTFFASLISFSNEIGKISASLPNINVSELFYSLYLDRRLMRSSGVQNLQANSVTSYLWPGIGFGGSCFPKDVRALIDFSLDRTVDVPFLQSVIETNEQQPKYLIDRFLSSLEEKPIRVAVLGLSFKPGTDDVRDSKSLEVIKLLSEKGIEIIAYDPLVKQMSHDPSLRFATSAESAIDQSDAIIIATSWKKFSSPEIVSCLIDKGCPILDCRLFLIEHSHKFSCYHGPGIPENTN